MMEDTLVVYLINSACGVMQGPLQLSRQSPKLQLS